MNLNLIWVQNSELSLSLNIDSKRKNDLPIEVSPIRVIPYEIVSFYFTLKKPSGQEIEFSRYLTFKDKNPDCIGDFCDQEQTILKKLNFEEGKYSLKISHYKSDLNLYGLTELRIIRK